LARSAPRPPAAPVIATVRSARSYFIECPPAVALVHFSGGCD
jgi:hypothetical protein